MCSMMILATMLRPLHFLLLHTRTHEHVRTYEHARVRTHIRTHATPVGGIGAMRTEGLAEQYVPEIKVGSSSSCCSDHQSFTENGFPAIGYFENEGEREGWG